MSEIGPHDTLHLEWIIHICLRHIWGTYSQWQLNKITKKVTPGVYKFDEKETTKHDIARQWTCSVLLQLDIGMHSNVVGTSAQLV